LSTAYPLVSGVRKILLAVLLLLNVDASSGTAKGGSLGVRTNDGRKHFTLTAEANWQLDAPRRERFDASGLVLWQGKLLTLNDRSSELYEIALGTNGQARLIPTVIFSRAGVARAAGQAQPRFDCEAIALDPEGNLYISEESQRGIFRTSGPAQKVERLTIDWSPVRRYFGRDANASFEGLAISSTKIFVANERDAARIIVVDRSTLRVEDSFFVDSEAFAFGGPHYSDLAFHQGRLFILNRNHRVIFELDPANRRVLAEYSFGQMEVAPEAAYRTAYPTGAMEGLAVDEKFFWLVTDNNGLGRIKYPKDARPTLFRCRRPGD
jgi:uncharacterized protein YjiK